jgi:uncharacterized protein DUF6498
MTATERESGQPAARPAASWLSASSLALVGANVIPVVGVLVLGWELFPLVLLYWLENGVVGAFNVLKIVTSQSREPAKTVQKLGMVPFFCMHYGIFWTVHGVFVMILFAGGSPGSGTSPSVSHVLDLVSRHGLAYALGAIVLSHGVSFVVNYLHKGERKKLLLVELMFAPYKRVVVLHIFILGGGAIAMLLGEPRAAVVLLALIKTIVDLGSHRHEHSGALAGYKQKLKAVYRQTSRTSGGLEPPPELSDSGFVRDLQAERSCRTPFRIASTIAIVLFVGGSALLAWLRSPKALPVLGAGVVAALVAAVLARRRRFARCPSCGHTMEMLERDIPPEQLSPLEQMACHVGPNGETFFRRANKQGPDIAGRIFSRWLVCRPCKRYFLYQSRHAQTVPPGSPIASALAQAHPWIDADPSETSSPAPEETDEA